MHPNPAFRQSPQERNIEFARQRAFGTLVVNADTGPLISHVPFHLSEDGKYLEAHLVRSNPILKLLDEPKNAAIAVTGPDGYVSPDWYGIDDQVPTWNYVAVHLRGSLKRLEDKALHAILVRLSADMEMRLAPKKPWTIEKMDVATYQRMLRQIVPIGMDVEKIDGTWKLSQNKPDEVRLKAAERIVGGGVGAELQSLAKLMQSG